VNERNSHPFYLVNYNINSCLKPKTSFGILKLLL